jgi:serine/threonine protein phosphatase PrpC
VLSSLWKGMSTVQAAGAGVALRSTIENANQHVFDTAKATGRSGMGATLTAVLFWGPYVYVAEIGDSRAYLLRGGCMVQLTRDQTYVQQLIDAGGLTREDAEKSALNGVVLQAMGIKPDIEVALNRISLRRGDRFLVCSDGLSGPLTDREMHDIITASPTLPAACAQLIEAAVKKGGQDDITVVLADVDGEGARVLTDAERISLDITQPMAPALEAAAPPAPAV